MTADPSTSQQLSAHHGVAKANASWGWRDASLIRLSRATLTWQVWHWSWDNWLPSYGFCCCGKPLTKNNLGKKGFPVHHEGKPGQESCVLACSPWLFSWRLHTTEDHLPRGRTAHSGSGTPLSIKNQKMTPDMPTGQDDGGGNPLTKVPSCQPEAT